MGSMKKGDGGESLELPVTPEWVRELRKAELHVHLLGSIRPTTALEFADRHGIPFPVDGEDRWAPFFARGDLAAFVEGFISLFEIVRSEEDLRRTISEAAEDWSRDGIAYTEPRITATSHLDRGFEADVLRRTLRDGRTEARKNHDLEIAWIVDFPRILGVDTGRRALEFAVSAMEDGVVGFDIAGYEGPFGEESDWADLFREAKRRGLRTTAHSGEIGSAIHVRTAVENWGVDRIGHGVRAVEDDSLLDLLRDRGIPIETNPSCNILLGNVPSLEFHPLEVFRKRGIPIVLNTDDPSLFGITLSGEIFQTAAAFGWDRGTVLSIIENGWRHRFGGKE